MKAQPMIRFRLLPMVAIVCGLLVSQAVADRQRPNILLILADDMGYECIGANGCLDYQTPHLDALAAGGARFEHCYAQPLCTPSRVKLMTGISNKRNYIRFGLLDRQQTTFAQLLKKRGYRTCMAGKWQLGTQPDGPQHFGFEQALLWQHTRGRTDEMLRDTRYPNPRLELNGVECDFRQGEYGPDLFVDFISQFMEANQDRPFLVYYPMALVHCPFVPTPDSADWDPTSRGDTNAKGDPKYFGEMVAYTDKLVGRLVRKLDELGLTERTLVIFTGDNGTNIPIITRTKAGPIAGAKGQMTDGGTHVPCIVSWPGVIEPDTVVSDLIDFSDFLPTICQAANVTLPPDLRLDGQTFLPQLRGEPAAPRDSIYMWYSRNGKAAEAQAFARNQRYKLYEDGRLFDLLSDRLELTPLADDTLNDEAIRARRLLQARIDSFRNVATPEGR